MIVQTRRSMGALGLACLLASLAMPGAAHAQTARRAPQSEATQSEAAPPESGTDDARDREARSLFEAGRTAFADGRFEDALVSFRRAHELSGRPALLYNIGAACDRLRRDDEALAAFEAYLAADPAASNRPEVEGRVAILRQRVAEAAAPAAAPEEPAPSAPGPDLTWTLVAGGASLVLGAIAIGAWVAANDGYGGLERGCYALRGGCTEDEIDASGVETWVAVTNGFFVASLVGAAATATILVLELTTERDERQVALRVGPSSIGIAGSF